MEKFLLTQKLGMSQIYNEKGRVVPVTLLWVEKNLVTEVRTEGKNGYKAVQVGAGLKKKGSSPLQGHVKGLVSKGVFKWIREYRLPVDRETSLKRGDEMPIANFGVGDRVRISGVSKGKGFEGVVKRWGFHGSPKTHGTKNTHRAPGSIGSSFPQHVRKGMKMGGRGGGDKKSVYMSVVKVDQESRVIMVDGPVPGTRGSLVEIRGV